MPTTHAAKTDYNNEYIPRCNNVSAPGALPRG